MKTIVSIIVALSICLLGVFYFYNKSNNISSVPKTDSQNLTAPKLAGLKSDGGQGEESNSSQNSGKDEFDSQDGSDINKIGTDGGLNQRGKIAPSSAASDFENRKTALKLAGLKSGGGQGEESSSSQNSGKDKFDSQDGSDINRVGTDGGLNQRGKTDPSSAASDFENRKTALKLAGLKSDGAQGEESSSSQNSGKDEFGSQDGSDINRVGTDGGLNQRGKIDPSSAASDFENRKVKKKKEPYIVYFGFDLYEPDDSSIIDLESFSKGLENLPIKRINIDGHTDSAGSFAYNDKLSLKRAKSVEKIMASHIFENKIEFIIRGHGENSPAFNNNTPENMAKNRRVVITIL